MSASRREDAQTSGVPAQGGSDASTPRLQSEVHKETDLDLIDRSGLDKLIADLTKDPIIVRSMRRDIAERQEDMDLEGRLSLEETFRDQMDAQIEYAKQLRNVGQRNGASEVHRLGEALGILEGFKNEGQKKEDILLGLKKADKARVERDRVQVERDQDERIDRLNIEVEGQKTIIASLMHELTNRPPADDAVIETLRSQLADITAELDPLATELNEPIVILLLEKSIGGGGHSAAVEERISVLTSLLRELSSDKKKMFDPSLEECWNLIRRLKAAGRDTSIYEESLNDGNIGAVLTTERFLREMVERDDKVQSAADPRILSTLSELESEVAQRVTDARLRVVPIGLIRFCRELLSDANDPSEVAPRMRTVKKIMELIKQYIS